MRPLDRAIGIVLGVIVGLGVVIVFVFFGSEGTIDAPRINQGATSTTQGAHGPHSRPASSQKPSTPPIAEVPVSGGAPPESGPAQLDYHQGDAVRLRVQSDSTIDVELLGYGISTTVAAGQPKLIAFKATRVGNFPLIVTASHIAIAQIRIDPR